MNCQATYGVNNDWNINEDYELIVFTIREAVK